MAKKTQSGKFHDPMKDKQVPAYVAEDTMEKLLEFRSPKYDDRSSCSMKAGEYHGVGHKQPVGHDGATKQVVAALPQHVITESLSYETDY